MRPSWPRSSAGWRGSIGPVPHGPWTLAVLRAIRANPERRAGDLAAELRAPRLPFKVDVRKLKELGLTESLPIGYRLSARGAAVLAHLEGP